MKCPNCDYENREGAKFCRKCGAALERICPQCKHHNEPDAMFCDECGTKLVEAEPTSPPKLEDMQKQLQDRIPQSLADKLFAGAKQMQGEYRLVTALFADVSGSSGMARELPLEQYVETMNDCFKMMVDTISIKYEGSINRFIGNCVLAFFGAPITHENDAERAILAALDIRESVKELGLEVSIGINTGMTYVGEMGSDLTYSERSAWGPDVDFARRLQEAAGPGQIWVGASTYSLTRRAFDFGKTVEIEAKGATGFAYPVLHVKEHPEKLRGIEGLRARMIGREHEFAELKESADQWLNGQGQMVSIIGEEGIGKSRLVAELRKYLASSIQNQASSILEGRCVSIGQPISYWPFIDILRTHFGFREEDDTHTIARKVTESITSLMPQGAEETLPLLGNLLSIKYGDELDDRLKFASPEQIRHQTLMRLRDIFRTLADQRPLMLILEDLHWADDLSLDLVSLLMDELANTPIILLCVYRPEKEHRVWQLGDQARRKCLDRYTEIRLNPLSSLQSRQLVESLLEIENLPEATKEVILTRSEGNPFFIEEVIRSLIEQDMVYQDGDHWKARDGIASISVPDTIQSVVLARVDRLQTEARYVLQCASVIGRLFRYRLLQHISRQEQDLDSYLAEFEEKELVYEERTVPELEYAFKHAFTQEATYEGILERKRREFHYLVAQGIERLYQEQLEEYYEELAHHYSLSDDAEKAVEYLLKAGDKAKSNYNNDVAISCYQKALEIIEQRGMGRNEWKLEALRGLGVIYGGIGRILDSIKAFEDALELAKGMKLSPRQMVRWYYWLSDSLYWQGRYDEIIRHGEMGLELLGDDDKCLEAALMNDRIAVGNFSKGDMEKAVDYIHKNMRFIKSLPYCVELANSYISIIVHLYNNVRDLETAWEWSEEYEKLAKKHNDLDSAGVALLLQGVILNMQGDYKGAISSTRKGLEVSVSV